MQRVTVMIRAKLHGKYPYLPVVVSRNGRIKPGVALVGGVEQKVDGSYYLRFTEDGERPRVAVRSWACQHRSIRRCARS